MERTYRIQVAAEMTGVSEGLIRAWERRYGVLKPRRTASGYRAYTDDDIEVLRRIKKLTEEGVSISEAVQLLPQIRRDVREQSDEQPKRAPRVEQLSSWRKEIIDAGERLDQPQVERLLDEAMVSLPPLGFFEELVVPLQREVGNRWHAKKLGIAEEHLISEAVRQRVVTLLHQAPRRARSHVVCACFPAEDHELGLMGVALRFRHAGWRVTFLGGRTPIEHLARVVEVLKPELVALSVVADSGEATFRRTLQAVMSALPPKTRVIVGGLGAEPYKSTVKSLAARTVTSESEWQELMG